jgi:hypothetical protein
MLFGRVREKFKFVYLPKKTMKILIAFTALLIVASGCATKIPLTNTIKQEYNLNETNIKKVQFFVSSQIILERSSKEGNSGTTSDGTLVSSENQIKDRIIIMPRTKCIFEKYGDNNSVLIRFEVGDGKFITFATRPNMDAGKLYLQADWIQGNGGKITYGNQEYFLTPESGNAFLLVKVKKSNRTKRKDRVVKGMKV